MNNLNLLIENLCPNGVKFIPLKDAAKMQRGTAITKKDIKDGPFPVVAGGQKPAYYCDSYNRDGETITVAGSGAYAGYIAYWNEPIFVSDAFSIKGNGNACTRYLFYVLQNLQEKIYATKKGGGVPHVHIASIEDFRIPLPPLPVQQEIVRILDNFTELTAELTAELAARRKQYEHYRDELLTFGDDVPYHQIKDICDIVDYRGKTPTKASDGIFLVTAKNIRKGYIDYEKSQEFIPVSDYEDVMRRGTPKIGDVLITTEAPCGNVAQVDREDIALAQRVIKYRPKSEILNSTYFKYVLLGTEFQGKLDAAATGGTVKGIKGSELHKLTVPIPSISEQKRLVSILERFDVFCNDLTYGLPAEIAARQKQYEYYRDKLLTFKELKA